MSTSRRSRAADDVARILVVDDDAHMREVLELILAGKDRHVESVGSGQVALERLAQDAYDLVVCDLQLSDLDGAAVYRAIERQPSPRPAVVFVTGAPAAGRYKAFLRTTQAPVLGKPFEINVLRETVRRALSRTWDTAPPLLPTINLSNSVIDLTPPGRSIGIECNGRPCGADPGY